MAEPFGKRLGVTLGKLGEGLRNFGKDFGEGLKEGKSQAEQEQSEAEKNELYKKARYDTDFHVVLDKAKDFSEEMLGNEATDADKEFVVSRYKAYKNIPEVKSALRALYKEVLLRETAEQSLDKKSAVKELPEHIVQLIDREIAKQSADNPEAINDLFDTIKEHNKILAEIKTQEAKQKETPGSSERVDHLIAQADIVTSLEGADFTKPETFTPEQRIAIREMATHLGLNEAKGEFIELPRRIKAAAKKLKESSVQIKEIESEMASLQEKIAPARKTLFTESVIGQELAEYAQQRTEAAYKDALGKAEGGDLAAAEKALKIHSDITQHGSEMGIEWGEFKDTNPAELEKLQRIAKENFVNTLTKEIKDSPSKNIPRLLDAAKATLLKRTQLGNQKGAEFAQLLTDAANEVHKKLKESGEGGKAITYYVFLADNKFLQK